MTERHNCIRDAFTFSLRGMTAIASFTAPHAIADDRINQVLDEKLRHVHGDQPDSAKEPTTSWGRFWLRSRYSGGAERSVTAKV